jgi:alkylation response protein AidB-like acyl-CoA dehydrogenase
VARPTNSGDWVLDGYAPWVTGWGLIDVVLAGARCGEDVVWLLLDAAPGPGFRAERVRLDTLDASVTMRVEWERQMVSAARVVGVEPFADWRRRDTANRQFNGYLAVGVAARAATLLGPSRLDEAVARARLALDTATPATVVDARTVASRLAVQAAAALVAAGGGRSVERGQPAARLMREAMFLLVFGQTGDIRAAQLAALGA